MTTPDARRRDLYNHLEEVLGPDRADTLMAYLPMNEAAELATRADLAALASRVEDVRVELKAAIEGVHTELRADMKDLRTDVRDAINDLLTETRGMRAEMGGMRTDIGTEMRATNRRIDRLFLTMGAGMVALLVAVATEYLVN